MRRDCLGLDIVMGQLERCLTLVDNQRLRRGVRRSETLGDGLLNILGVLHRERITQDAADGDELFLGAGADRAGEAVFEQDDRRTW